jgi:hypothetical protein
VFYLRSLGTRTDPVKLFGTHAQPSEVLRTRTCACGLDNLGGSITTSIGARSSIIRSHTYFQNKFLVLKNLFSTKYIVWF